MDTTQRFSTKAEKYARYRWDYVPAAIETIFSTTGLTSDSVVADIGAGTGILTKHFLGRVGRVFAVEPNPEMRGLAERTLSGQTGFAAIDGRSEVTTLPDGSVDLITAAQALHWFDPEPTRREFWRIIRPGGWLAILWNANADPELANALRGLFTEENGCDTNRKNYWERERQDYEFYFGHTGFQQLTFPQQVALPWDEFFGTVLSDSHSPDEDHPRFGNFEAAASALFDRYSQSGLLQENYQTWLILGSVVKF